MNLNGVQYWQHRLQRSDKALRLCEWLRFLLLKLLQLWNVRFLEYDCLARFMRMLCALHFYDGSEVKTDESSTVKHDDGELRTNVWSASSSLITNCRHSLIASFLWSTSSGRRQRSSAIFCPSGTSWRDSAIGRQQPTYNTSQSDTKHWSKRHAYCKLDTHGRRHSYVCVKCLAEISQLQPR